MFGLSCCDGTFFRKNNSLVSSPTAPSRPHQKRSEIVEDRTSGVWSSQYPCAQASPQYNRQHHRFLSDKRIVRRSKTKTISVCSQVGRNFFPVSVPVLYRTSCGTNPTLEYSPQKEENLPRAYVDTSKPDRPMCISIPSIGADFEISKEIEEEVGILRELRDRPNLTTAVLDYPLFHNLIANGQEELMELFFQCLTDNYLLHNVPQDKILTIAALANAFCCPKVQDACEQRILLLDFLGDLPEFSDEYNDNERLSSHLTVESALAYAQAYNRVDLGQKLFDQILSKNEGLIARQSRIDNYVRRGIFTKYGDLLTDLSGHICQGLTLQGLNTIIQHNSNIRGIDLRRTALPLNEICFKDNLEELHVPYYVDVKDAHLQEVIQKLPKLRILDLSRTKYTLKGVAFGKALEELDLSWCKNIKEEDLQRALQKSVNLKKLETQYSSLKSGTA